MSFIFSAAIIVLLLMSFYLGKRLQLCFNIKWLGFCRVCYWTVIFLSVFLLLISRLLRSISTHWLPWLGNIVFGIVICAICILFIFDIVRWLSHKRFKPNLITKIFYLICVTGLFTFGHYMATNPKIVYYQVAIAKPANVEHLRIVQITDIHINESTSQEFIQNMVVNINQLNPDLVFVTGDIIDGRLKPFTLQGFDKQFQQIRSKYGVYAILGNHEYLGVREKSNSIEDVITAFKAANMTVMRDEVIYNDKLGITLIGRDDISASLYDTARASLSDLMLFSETTTPIILLDHQPKNLEEPVELNVDLMFSGHTHGGQVFPITLLVKLMYKNADGVYQDLKNHFTSIVSSGYGYWGPPIRLMTRSEIVVVDVTFKAKNDTSLNLTE